MYVISTILFKIDVSTYSADWCCYRFKVLKHLVAIKLRQPRKLCESVRAMYLSVSIVLLADEKEMLGSSCSEELSRLDKTNNNFHCQLILLFCFYCFSFYCIQGCHKISDRCCSDLDTCNKLVALSVNLTYM